jgi:wobble nucleotide-excising tRNase
MPITSITIKNVASYDNSGVTINNLKKLNFFIGSNGSGKSTIARCIRNHSLQASLQDQAYKDCKILGYNPSQEEMLIYDELFKQTNFIETNEIKGVFSLNSTNAAIDSKIKEIEAKLDYLRGAEEQLNERERKCSETEQRIHDSIVSNSFYLRRNLNVFSKVKFQYSGSKESHFNHLISIENDMEDDIEFDTLQKEYRKLYDSEHSKITNNLENNIWEEAIQSEKNLKEWLVKIIVGHESIEISKLIQNLSMSSWVDSGRIYLEQSGDVCPFCQQPIIDKDKLAQDLNAFFDQTYTDNISSLREAGNRYYKSIEQLKQKIKALRDNKLLSDICYKFESELIEVSEKNLSAVREKLVNPNEQKDVISIELLYQFVEELNQMISENNNNVENLSILQKQWEANCWKWMRQELDDQINKYNLKKKYLDSIIKPSIALHHQKIEGERAYYVSSIEKLRQLTVNTKDAVDAINVILNNVGFKDFVIEEVPSTSVSTQYRLKRVSGSSQTNIYKSLSEGEKTFISFLYFYQLCIGTDNPNKSSFKKIIVIDDPISSLDNHIMFIVSSIIHKLDIQSKSDKHQFKDTNINQIVTLTHNLYFYKEITLGRRPMCQDLAYYRVSKDTFGCSKIDYSTKSYPADDYTLLWGVIKDNKTSTGIDEGRNIMLCNVMRRIIDSYVNFIGLRGSTGNPTWASINSMDTTNPVYIVASSFISQINDDSHGVSPLDSSYYGNIVRYDTTILFNAFKLIFDEIGPNHYAMMMTS